MAVTQTLTVIEVSGSVNTIDNTSQVRILWKSTQTNESYNDYTRTAKYYVSINGEAETEYSVSYTLPLKSTTTIVDTTITVAHRSDGSGTVSVRTWMDTSISAGVVEKSQTRTLTTIPKAATIISASPVELGGKCQIEWTPTSASLFHKFEFTLGTWSHTTGLIKTNATSSSIYAGVSIPMDVASNFPNAPSGTMTVTLYTYSDIKQTNQVGSASSATFTVTLPNNNATQPSVTMDISPVTPYEKFSSLYLKGISKVKADLGFTTKYGATVAASTITVNGKTYGDPYESDILSQSGTLSVKATVKDSRGYYGTYYKVIEVIPYEKPYIQAKSNETSIIAARCNSSADFTDSGTYLKIKAKIVCSKVISKGVQYNYGFIKYRYRKEGGAYSAWKTILDCKTNNSDEVITPPLENGALDIESNYQVQIIASDYLYESAPITIVVPSETVYMDRPVGGKSMGLGGYSSGDGILDIHWKTKARGGLSMFDGKGDEIPLDSTLPLPRGQVAEGWNPDELENGAYVVTSTKALKSGETVIMHNGVLIQMNGTVDGRVKIQLALTSDETKNPFYRAYWYGNWGNWRSFKL